MVSDAQLLTSFAFAGPRACSSVFFLSCLVFFGRLQQAPAILLPTLALSKRLHSIFVLRLFNDPCAMLLFYASTWLLCKRRWSAASVVYSLALSIKMNILLFLPALGLIFFRALGFWGALAEAATIVLVQVSCALAKKGAHRPCVPDITFVFRLPRFCSPCPSHSTHPHHTSPEPSISRASFCTNGPSTSVSCRRTSSSTNGYRQDCSSATLASWRFLDSGDGQGSERKDGRGSPDDGVEAK